MKKKIFIFVIFIACFSMIIAPNLQQNIYAAGFFDLVFSKPEPAVGDYINNLIMVNFNGEDPLDSYAENTYDFFDTAYNTTDYSLKKFYNTVSNSKLNLQTQIVADTQGNVQTIQLSEDREYFMNYMYRDYSNTWHTNTNGYFSYELVQSSKAPTSELDFEFYLNSTHKYFVYDDSNGAPADTDTSDGIISMSYAESLQSSNSNYYIVNSFERYLRELKLMKLISLDFQQYVDFSKADKNNDGNVDIISLNIIDNPQKDYRIEWSELLWAHQSTIGIFYNTEILYGMTLDSLISSGGYLLSMAKSLLQSFLNAHCYDVGEVEGYLECVLDRPYVTNGTDSLYIDRFFLNTLDCSDLEATQDAEICTKLEIGTVAHELGHLFGLPDLYLYPSNSTEATSIWSLMCSSGNPPQYFTAYERYQLGWLDTTNNIKTITSSGEYTVNVTKGYDGTNTVAFVVQGTGDYEKQYFYFEYRNKDLAENYFEKNIGEPGLICYRIDTTVSSGNMEAKPYGLYVFSESGYAGKTSSLKAGESFGNYDIRKTDKAITYQKTTSDEIEYVNAGIYVEVKQASDNQLTFNVSLFENDRDSIQLNVINGNKTITVGQQYVEDGIQILENGTQVSYELSTTLDGTKQYKIEYFETDESFASQTTISSITTARAGYYLVKYTVVDKYGFEYEATRQVTVEEEKIEVTNLDKTLENALKDFTGEQTLYTISLKNYELVDLAGYNLTTIQGLEQFEFKNNVHIDLGDNNLTQYSQITSLADKLSECKISVVANNFKTTDYSSNSKIIFGIQKQPQYTLVEMPISLSDLPSCIEDYSDEYGLYHNGTLVNDYSNITSLNYGINTFGLRARDLFSDVEITVCYVAFEQIKTSQVVAINTQYSFVASEWLKAYGEDLSTFEVQNTMNTIDFSTEGQKTFTITVVVDNNQKFVVNCEILVQNKRVIVEDVNQTLLQRILEITNQTVPYQDILEQFDYIDLSALGLESISGLEKFTLKQYAVIDFADNNVKLASDIQTFINKANTNVTVLVAGNQLSEQEGEKLPNNVIVGVQQLQQYVVYTTNTINANLPVKYDFAGVYELYINNQKVTSNFVVSVFDTYVVELRSQTYHNVSQTTSYVAICKKSEEAISIDYKQDVNSIDALQYFTLINLNQNDLQIAKTYLEQTQTIQFEFKLADKTLATLSYSIIIIDNDKPNITLNGETVVYVTSKQQYMELYSEDEVVAVDENDGVCQVQTNMPDMTNYGIYTIRYTATDKAGNQAFVERMVYVGNIELEQLTVVNYKSKKVLEITFETFDEQDFKITYAFDNGEYADYDKQNGIVFNSYGNVVLKFKAACISKPSFVIEKQMAIEVKDLTAPTLELIGEAIISLEYGQVYNEQGFIVVDNCDENEITKTIQIKNPNNQIVSHIDSTVVGEYTITYKATDKGGYISSIIRKVVVNYEKITSITIQKPNITFVVGKEIRLSLKIEKGENSNPTPTILWYVDDNLVETTTGLTKTLVFNKAGTYNVKAVVEGENIETDIIKITVSEAEKQQGSMLPLVIGAVVVVGIIAGIFISIFIKRKRSLI